MARRFFRNLGVNLAAGFLLFFFSERLFWTAFKPGDHVGELAITWLAYSVVGCVFLNVLKRLEVRTLPRIALAGAVYGWLTEGALVGTLYGTEDSAPFPISLVQTGLSWHMLISVLVGWHFLTGSVREGRWRKTVLISVGVGLFWGAWAPFQWRETPPVIVSPWTFAAHAAITGGLLAMASGIISGDAWGNYKPGWFGLGFSILVICVFYSQQVKALGARPLIVLPLVIGGTLALLRWTQPCSNQDATLLPKASARDRWRGAALVCLMPLVASLTYTFQILLKVRGVNPATIFNGLALAGGGFFLAACVIVIKQRFASK